MSIALVAPGKPMRISPALIALASSIANRDGGSPPNTVPDPAELPSLIAWWDASRANGVLTPAGSPATDWHQPIGTILDKSATGNALIPFSANRSSPAPRTTPRLNGTLGGIGCLIGATGTYAPDLDPDGGYCPESDPFPRVGDWTFVLVWSRPNWRQRSGKDGQPVTLLMIRGTPVLQADSQGGLNRLVLAISEPITISENLGRRHTHCVILRYSAREGVDAWLDGVRVVTGAAGDLDANQLGATLLLHDGSVQGGAQCWFHESAVWNEALSEGDIATLTTYATRWKCGSRRGITLVINGQSNAINYSLQDGGARLLAQGIAWHLGALAYNTVASTGNPASYTMQSGHGIYPALNGSYPGNFLADPGDGSDPSTWQVGQDGVALCRAIADLTEEDRQDICGFVWPWNETDSLRNYSEKSTFAAAARRLLALERGLLSGTAESLPLIWWNAIPYGSQDGIQMHREVVAEAAADPNLNVWIGNPQTTDSNPRGSTWDPATGIATGGDYGHRDSLDNQRFARLAAPVAAHALANAQHGDGFQSLPAGVPKKGGPSIVYVHRLRDDMLVLSIVHDAGNDLKVPLQAGNGCGFAVMDGGSAQNPGLVVSAVSCVRIDATHLRLTLARPLSRRSSECHLYYPFAGNSIGRGNAVTDNYSEVAKPAGWDIAADLGSAWNLDFPLAAIAAPIPLSDTAE